MDRKNDFKRFVILMSTLGEATPGEMPTSEKIEIYYRLLEDMDYNLMADKKGMPAIIDPAVHFGWAEADLAMTDLFGSYPSEFYRAYNEVRPLDPGYRNRYKIYNLYHLLNHLNLFGSGYLSQVRMVLAQYT